MFSFSKPLTWKYMPLYEKIGYYKTILDERFAFYVDKISAKQFIQEKYPEIQTSKLIRILSDPMDLHISDFHPHNLLKASHGSGYNILLNDPTQLDSIQQKLQTWNKSYSGDEKQYTYIQPRFFIEEIINDKYSGLSGLSYVFMFRCIHGKVISTGVRLGGSTIQNSYNIHFIPFEPLKFDLEKPIQWEQMIAYAEKLSTPFEFVRIDFYISVDGHIYFSEFTFTPAGGNRVYSIKNEFAFGKLWK